MSYVHCTRRRRKGKHLDYAERQELEWLVRENHEAAKSKRKTQKQLAQLLGVSEATLSRELKRGRVVLRDSDWREYVSYSADVAQADYDRKATLKGPGLKIGNDHALAKHIEQKILQEKYSPDAVIMELRAGKYSFKTSICTRTLYNYIDQGVFANLTNKDLPRQGRSPKRSYKRVRKAYRNVGGKTITERPEEANKCLEYGHWEMDCLKSGRGGRSCLLVMVERMTRETIILKLRSQTQAEVQRKLNQLERSMGRKRFARKFKSITVDNGSEFLGWEMLEKSCLKANTKRTAIYYCHPYSAWERGTNEQINGHIRRFIPKGSDISKYTNQQLKAIETWLNTYPRRILNGISAWEAVESLARAG